MKVLIIDNGTKHLINLKRLLSIYDVTILPFSDNYLNPDQYGLIILSGGSSFAIAQNPEKFTNEMNLIKNSNIPIIGICEGCEIIAYTYGSKLESFEPKSKGIKEIEIIDKSQLNFPSPIKVYEAHHWAIIKLGRKLLGIAKSVTGFEIIKHEEKPIYGLQFHPEMFVDETLGDEIFNKLITLTKH